VTSRATSDVAAVATGFSRSLRRAGLDAPPSATLDFAEALSLLGMGNPAHVFWAGRACFCRTREDTEIYAATFLAFFARRVEPFSGGRLTTVPPSPVLRSRPVAPAGASPTDDDEESDQHSSRHDPLPVAYSATEVLRAKNFAACSDAELDEALRLMSKLRRGAAMRPGRRLRSSRSTRRGRIDVRRTLRESLGTGGELTHLARSERQQRPRRVVLLLDVSGSMRPYARAMLRFAHAAILSRRQVEAFTLGTRCTRVTRELSWRDPDAALRRAAAAAPDLDGGTRLGECLHEFNETWGAGGLARGAVVVINSDGWDRGDPAVLATAMGRLSRVAHRIVWVNPLMVTEDYEPLVRGMAAALPFTDEFVSGHSLGALDELAEVLSQ
jgi:hypothetical protein